MTEEFIGSLVADMLAEWHKLIISAEMLQGWLREQGATQTPSSGLAGCQTVIMKMELPSP